MPRRSPCGNSAALAQLTALVPRPYRPLLQSCASPGIDVLLGSMCYVFSSRPLIKHPASGCRALVSGHRLQQKRMPRPPISGPAGAARAPGTPGQRGDGLAQPALIDLLARGVARDAVALLHLAGELLAAARDHCEIVVRELSPLLLGSAPELLPITFDAIPIHEYSPCHGY